MAKYSSNPVLIPKAAAEVAEKFSDLSKMQSVLDAMPSDQRAQVGDVDLTPDSIHIHTQQVGEIEFTVTERTPQRVVFSAKGAPVPLSLIIGLKAVAPEETELTTTMDVDIPIFLKPVVGPALQKAVDQFGQLMQQLA